MSDLTPRFDVSDLVDFLCDTTWQDEIQLDASDLIEICESVAQLVEAESC